MNRKILMDETTTREKIFKSIRNALIEKTAVPFPNVDFESSVFLPLRESLDVTFAQEFTKVAGKFIYCENEAEMAEKLKYLIDQNKLEEVFCIEERLRMLLEEHGIVLNETATEFQNVKVGITLCEFLVSRLGSIMISSRQLSGRRLNVFPEIHIVVAYTTQLVPDLKDAFAQLKIKYQNVIPSMITVITGPSRTADIEKTLVMGAHGPKEIYVLLVESN
jgi:L-lactate dehydrogenase complex protein LldG